jgi:signal transduction histidine kinase
MLEVSVRLTNAERGSLFLMDAAGEVTNSILTRGRATLDQRRALIGKVMREGLAGWVARARQVALITDTLSDPRWVKLPYEPFPTRSALAVPIMRGEVLHGVLNLLHQQPNHFTTRHANLMRVTADQMALALDNARLYAAVQQELGERRRAEAALQQANEQLAAAKGQLERWMEARAKETSSAVHDIRHGVRDVMSALEVLVLDLADAGVSPPLYQGGVQRTQEALDALLTLLSDMLDAALLQSNALVLRPVPTDLAALVTQVAQRLAPRYRMFDCRLLIEAPEGMPLAWCDGRRMARVLYNLLHNAVQYTAARDDDRQEGLVRVTLALENDKLVCRVSDNGLGIAPEHLARLGQRFTRVGDGTPEGSGMGLSFCSGIMRLHGGTFAITSPGRGHGTTVILSLPLAPAAAV